MSMSKYKKVFSQSVIDKKIYVDCGKQAAIPDGIWSILPSNFFDEKTYPYSPSMIPVATPPRIGAKRAFWIEATSPDNGLTAWVTVRSHTSRKGSYPYASDIDKWSAALHHSVCSASWRIDLSDGIAGEEPKLRPSIKALSLWLCGQATTVSKDTRDILVTLGLHGSMLEEFDVCMKLNSAKKAKVLQKSAEKAKETRKMVKKNGGNPKKLKEGDLVVTTRPMTFRNGKTYQIFRWVRPREDINANPGCFLMTDSSGYGIGARYKAPKKELRKVCAGAWDEVEGLSAHEIMTLMRQQGEIEIKREEEKKRAKKESDALFAELSESNDGSS